MKKINWLLILQAWAMLWVVIGHAFLGDLSTINEWPSYAKVLMSIAYSFHMPLFMVISGWLFYYTRIDIGQLNASRKRWSYSLIIKDKTLRILLPGFTFSILAFVVKLVFPGEMARQAGVSLHEIVMAYVYPFDNPFRELWFIFALFWMFVLFPVWRWTLENRWTMWTTVVLLLMLHFYIPDTKALAFDRVCLHGIWFYLGMVISKEDVVNNLFRNNLLSTIIIGVAVYLLGLYTEIEFLRNVGGIVFSFGFSLFIDFFLPRTFISFRSYTYQIFLMGIFAQMAVKITYRHVNIPYLETYLLCILAGIYVPVFVSKVLEKIKLKPLLLCTGLRESK